MLKSTYDYLKKNPLLLSISIIIFLLNLSFTSLPLVNLLSYESSAINGILLSLLSGIFWLYEYNADTNKKIVAGSLFIFLPFFILTFSTVFCSTCPINDGIYFYIILTIPSLIVGITLARFAKFINNRFRVVLFIVMWILLLFGFLPELYFNPQVYFYNPIFGYYPGVIYDQSIEISSSLVLYRLIILFLCFLIMALMREKYSFNKITKVVVISIVMVLTLIFYMNKSVLGFSTKISSIKNELNGEIETKHFYILYPKDLKESEIKLLEYEHEYYYYTISKQLNVNLNQKITSIVFESGAQKKKLFGSRNADVAKPWLFQIYLNYDNYHNSLKHEIAHIFSGKFISGVFKVPSDFNPGMIEGFAMAVENNFDNFDIDYIAALAFKNDFRISLDKLFNSYSFFSNVSSLSYIYSGSFMKFLAEKYDWEKFTDVYSSGDFKGIFDSQIDELEKDYYKYLDSLEIQNFEHRAKYYFGRLPLLKKYCARATAKELRNAQNLYNQKEYAKASIKFFEIYNYSNSYRALVGYLFAERELGNISASIDVLEDEINKFKDTSFYYYLEFLLADFYALENNSEKADYYYSSLIDQNPHLNYVTSAKFKRDLLTQNDSTLIRYMSNSDYKSEILKKYVSESPDDNVIQLFLKRADKNILEVTEKLELINRISKKQFFSSDTYFLISLFAYRNLYFEDALKYAELSLISADFKRKSVIEEHIEKIKWLNFNYAFQN